MFHENRLKLVTCTIGERKFWLIWADLSSRRGSVLILVGWIHTKKWWCKWFIVRQDKIDLIRHIVKLQYQQICKLFPANLPNDCPSISPQPAMNMEVAPYQHTNCHAIQEMIFCFPILLPHSICLSCTVLGTLNVVWHFVLSRLVQFFHFYCVSLFYTFVICLMEKIAPPWAFSKHI